jgi:hypothetical protein
VADKVALASSQKGREGFRRGKVRNTLASTHGQGSHGVNRNLRCAERSINLLLLTSMDERTSSSWHGTSRRYAHKKAAMVLCFQPTAAYGVPIPEAPKSAFGAV